MANSMTGFGLGEFINDEYYISVEMKTVNHKFLDMNFRLPKKVSFLEEKVRNKIKAYISRGRVDIFVKFESLKSSGVELKYDSELARQYFNILNKIKDDFCINEDIKYKDIASFSDVISILEAKDDEEILWNALDTALNSALEQLMNMRRLEGQKLKDDVLMRCDILKSKINSVEEFSNDIVFEQKEKFELRIKDILKDIEIDENRLAQEIAIFADKSNVTEEIVRFKSHIVQLRDTICLGIPIGRKIDFLIQEMNREINTVGSKTTKIEVTNLVIDIKSELEKIREQIQNIE